MSSNLSIEQLNWITNLLNEHGITDPSKDPDNVVKDVFSILKGKGLSEIQKKLQVGIGKKTVESIAQQLRDCAGLRWETSFVEPEENNAGSKTNIQKEPVAMKKNPKEEQEQAAKASKEVSAANATSKPPKNNEVTGETEAQDEKQSLTVEAAATQLIKAIFLHISTTAPQNPTRISNMKAKNPLLPPKVWHRLVWLCRQLQKHRPYAGELSAKEAKTLIRKMEKELKERNAPKRTSIQTKTQGGNSETGAKSITSSATTAQTNILVVDPETGLTEDGEVIVAAGSYLADSVISIPDEADPEPLSQEPPQQQVGAAVQATFVEAEHLDPSTLMAGFYPPGYTQCSNLGTGALSAGVAVAAARDQTERTLFSTRELQNLFNNVTDHAVSLSLRGVETILKEVTSLSLRGVETILKEVTSLSRWVLAMILLVVVVGSGFTLWESWNNRNNLSQQQNLSTELHDRLEKAKSEARDLLALYQEKELTLVTSTAEPATLQQIVIEADKSVHELSNSPLTLELIKGLIQKIESLEYELFIQKAALNESLATAR